MNFGLLLLLLAPLFCQAIDKLSENEARAVATSLVEDVFLIETTEEEVAKIHSFPYQTISTDGHLRYYYVKALTELIRRERKALLETLSKHEASQLRLETEELHDLEIRGKIENLNREAHIEFSEKELEHITNNFGGPVVIDGFDFVAQMYLPNTTITIHYGVVFENQKFLLKNETWIRGEVTTTKPFV
ncbi:unnamed protein product [Caenorhabditis angaria]|uniref:DUF38 domain-containing protein n=1 Tax=Caenorhabditis angaria TaxID=860376 RepID=A0A9P1MY16_9PELO|nr:unnamed protein product [Caenorhabditis angaria]